MFNWNIANKSLILSSWIGRSRIQTDFICSLYWFYSTKVPSLLTRVRAELLKRSFQWYLTWSSPNILIDSRWQQRARAAWDGIFSRCLKFAGSIAKKINMGRNKNRLRPGLWSCPNSLGQLETQSAESHALGWYQFWNLPVSAEQRVKADKATKLSFDRYEY